MTFAPLPRPDCDGRPLFLTTAGTPDAPRQYLTSPRYCSCPDYKFRRRPCKHMKGLLEWLTDLPPTSPPADHPALG